MPHPCGSSAVGGGGGATVIRIPPAAPNGNAVCERFLGSVRRECLDHILILSDDHLRSALRAFCAHFTSPAHTKASVSVYPVDTHDLGSPAKPREQVRLSNSLVLGGLHHEYRAAA